MVNLSMRMFHHSYVLYNVVTTQEQIISRNDSGGSFDIKHYTTGVLHLSYIFHRTKHKQKTIKSKQKHKQPNQNNNNNIIKYNNDI